MSRRRQSYRLYRPIDRDAYARAHYGERRRRLLDDDGHPVPIDAYRRREMEADDAEAPTVPVVLLFVAGLVGTPLLWWAGLAFGLWWAGR